MGCPNIGFLLTYCPILLFNGLTATGFRGLPYYQYPQNQLNDPDGQIKNLQEMSEPDHDSLHNDPDDKAAAEKNAYITCQLLSHVNKESPYQSQYTMEGHQDDPGYQEIPERSIIQHTDRHLHDRAVRSKDQHQAAWYCSDGHEQKDGAQPDEKSFLLQIKPPYSLGSNG